MMKSMIIINIIIMMMKDIRFLDKINMQQIKVMNVMKFDKER